jgi:predicted RNase H-like HicB family nuclease
MGTCGNGGGFAPALVTPFRGAPDRIEEKAKMVSYAVRLVTRYDGLVIATFPDLPGVTALGRDDEEARDEARRALADALAAFEAEGVPPPPPITQAGSTVSVELVARPMPA